MRYKDISGQRFGRLVVQRDVGRTLKNNALWECLCDCGSTTITTTGKLKSGHTASCGCRQLESNLKHGETHTHGASPEWRSWRAMRNRCTRNPKRREYKYYAARGITVCERWEGIDGFQHFLEDMGRMPGPGYSIDRIDNDGNYEPGNCKWSTRSEQMKNARRSKLPARKGNRWVSSRATT